MSWLCVLLSWQRSGVSVVAFCLLRHMQTRKKRQAMTNGMAVAGIRMNIISFLWFSGGSGDSKNFELSPLISNSMMLTAIFSFSLNILCVVSMYCKYLS